MTHRILIADDEPLYLRTTGDLLRRAGYECICVPDADTAIEKLHREQFDLVLSDLNMPGNVKAEHQYLIKLLKQHTGNVTEAARQAGMSRQGLHKLLKTQDLSAADFR